MHETLKEWENKWMGFCRCSRNMNWFVVICKWKFITLKNNIILVNIEGGKGLNYLSCPLVN